MPNHRRRRWRDANAVRLDLNALLAGAVGTDGMTPDEWAGLESTLARVRDEMAAHRAAGGHPFADLPYRRDDVQAVLAAAGAIGDAFDTLVVLGIGGSALGARALQGALAPPGIGLRVIVVDTIDPESFGAVLGGLDLQRTLFNVISKSGETVETMAQFLIVRDRLLRELGAVDYKRHLVVTTDPQQGAMRQIVNDEGFGALPIPPGVDGRFSVLTPVGLYPAAAAGVDVEELLAGAIAMDERRQAATSPLADPALALAAALWFLRTQRSKPVVVMAAYCERLAATTDWFAELWAETLGRAVDREGRTVEWGQTAIRSLGPADQHSQLQLWVEGPRDKVVVFLRLEDHGAEVVIPANYQDLESVGYLGGRTLGELLNAEQRATELALARRGRPSATLTLPVLNAFTFGQLLYLLETAAVATAALAGIDPYGQPGVEEGKRFAYGLMGRPGFDAFRTEVEAWNARKDGRYVI
jgi:glucose-6-phosphate isomerase